MPFRVAVAVVLLWSSVALFAGEIRGKVTNAAGGEALGHIQVAIPEIKIEAVTAGDGTFLLPNVPAGNHTLRLSAVGYRLMNVPVSVASADASVELSLVMVPDNYRRTETVEVRADVFQAEDSPAVLEENLTSSEIRQASTVLADDPFRSVQALPGVSAAGNNELLAQFSVLGSPFTDVGIYIDDVLILNPLHQDVSQQNSASLSILTSEVVESMKLLPVAYPERYGDDIGAALDIRTRDGSRTRPLFRISVGLGDTDGVAEGQLGRARRGSWLIAARKSYLGYIVHDFIRSDFADIGFYDGEAKVTYDLTRKHNVSLFALGGRTRVNDTSITAADDTRLTESDLFLYRAGWRWSATPHLLIDSYAAYWREPTVAKNPSGTVLNRYSYDEYAGGSHGAWAWSKDAVLEAGWALHRDAYRNTNYFVGQPPPPPYIISNSWVWGDGYLQQSGTVFGGRLHLMGGLRVDAQDHSSVAPVSPQVSAAYRVTRGAEVQFGYARYGQITAPVYEPVAGCFQSQQYWTRSTHYTGGVEQRLSEGMRLRFQVFDRENDFNQIYDRASPCPPAQFPGDRTRQRFYSRGAQIVLQRRSSNRLSGWIGYTFVQARANVSLLNPETHDVVFSPYYATAEDQPHAVNAFGMYRLRPSINLSGKVLFGSGYPARTGLEFTSNGWQVVPVVRLPDYLRVDLRCDKSWAFSRWKMTLYSEVINLTDHDNRIIDSVTSDSTGKVVIKTESALPITPTVGVVFEF
jgi:hypothetical protein